MWGNFVLYACVVMLVTLCIKLVEQDNMAVKQSGSEKYTYMCSGVHFPEGVLSQSLEMVT